MTTKPRIGRPKGDGTYRSIGVYGTEHEIDAVLELTPRQRMEAMLATIRDDTPSGHRNDGGHWIACPFCEDDELGMCSACNGTRRIWEMPAE